MSYNNYVDINLVWWVVFDFEVFCVVVIKYLNLCGIVIGFDIVEVYCKVYVCDFLSVFGGVIVINCLVSVEMVEQVVEIFIEVVVVFGYEDGVVEILFCKKNIWLLECFVLYLVGWELCQIDGGLLVMEIDFFQVNGDDLVNWILVVGDLVDDVILVDLFFVWWVCCLVRFNVILLVYDGVLVGVGMG